MKIKVKNSSYDEVIALERKKHKRPNTPNIFFRTLLRLVSLPDLLKTSFKCERIGMEKLGKNEPCLVLMNHSSFIDLEIVVSLLYPRRFNIVATSDSFIGMNWIMRRIGCTPTKKFIADPTLVRDMMHSVRKLGNSVVLFPEASYSFDGTATPLPDTIGKLVKMLGVPVVMIRTYGAFHRDPLYNNLQVRRVKVSATEELILTAEDVKTKTDAEIGAIVNEQFSFDNFKWQKETKLRVAEPFRADYLHRVLYKCPHCGAEGKMHGEGISLICRECGKAYTLDEYGYLRAEDGDTKFDHIPDWYAWQRDEVRREIVGGTYRLDVPVDIMMTIDTYGLYRVGEGRLVHTASGFVLDGCEGKLHYEQKPLESYSLYSDFNWYEIGDVISIGDYQTQYYCFPKGDFVSVAKARLAAEELYKMTKKR